MPPCVITKRPTVPTKRLGTSTKDSDQPVSRSSKKVKPQNIQSSFLRRVDSLHEQTESKAKRRASRLTITPRNMRRVVASEDDPPLGIDEPVQKDNKHNATGPDEYDFSDEEMDAAMAALPASTSTEKKPPTITSRTRQRSKSSDKVVAEQPPRKRRRQSLDRLDIQKASRASMNGHSFDIIELDSSSDKSPDVIASPRAPKVPLATVAKASHKHSIFSQSQDDSLPLFLSSSSQAFVNDPIRSRDESGTTSTPVDKEFDFQLDPNLFEGGEETLMALASPIPAKTISKLSEPLKPMELRNNSELPKRHAPLTSQKTKETNGAESHSLLEALGDQTVFETFFSSIEFV